MISKIIGINSTEDIKNNNIDNKILFCSKHQKENDSFVKSDIDIKCRFFKDSLSGTINGMSFNLSHPNLLMGVGIMNTVLYVNNKDITGDINNKEVKLHYKKNLFKKDSLKGAVGDTDVDLKISRSFLWNKVKIKGTYGNDKVDLKFRKNPLGYKIKSENTDLQIKGKHILSNDLSVKGSFNENKELLPLIIDMINDDRHGRY